MEKPKKPKKPLEIEFINFYPFEIDASGFKGTLHVYIKTIGMNYMGIRVRLNKKGWWFGFPQGTGFNHETQTKTIYPLLCFKDRDRNKELNKFITTKGKEFILNKMREGQNMEKKNES